MSRTSVDGWKTLRARSLNGFPRRVLRNETLDGSWKLHSRDVGLQRQQIDRKRRALERNCALTAGTAVEAPGSGRRRRAAVPSPHPPSADTLRRSLTPSPGAAYLQCLVSPGNVVADSPRSRRRASCSEGPPCRLAGCPEDCAGPWTITSGIAGTPGGVPALTFWPRQWAGIRTSTSETTTTE